MEHITLSDEQNDIISSLATCNVLVDSVAGSGKTTTSLGIATRYPEKKILLLTYNARLKNETRQKIMAMGLTNIEAHSYHAMCCKFYKPGCKNDTAMQKIITGAFMPCRIMNFDIIIVDEAQDMSKLYYSLLCKIYNDNGAPATLCIVGDYRQSIFQCNGADKRYIQLAHQVFKFNDLPWAKHKLSYSFRVPTEITTFLNKAVFKEEFIKSQKTIGYAPRYIICQPFAKHIGSAVFKEVEYYLRQYKPEDIFILAPSTRANGSRLSPIKELENLIKRKTKHNIYVPLSDEEKIDEDVMKGKLVFSSFHQVKGLERKVVIVFSFDSSYFQFYGKDLPHSECPNAVYVALTRAKERLSIIHGCKNEYLQFLSIKHTFENCEVIKERANYNPTQNPVVGAGRRMQYSVTELLRFIPHDVVSKCLEKTQVEKFKENMEELVITNKIKNDNKNIHEAVGHINGTAIPIMHEFRQTGKIGMAKNMRKWCKADQKEFIKGIRIGKNLTTEQIIKLVMCHLSIGSNYINQLYQIENFSWLEPELVDSCMERLNALGISKTSNYEYGVILKDEPELKGHVIYGYMDLRDEENKKIYEFKCTGELDRMHMLQLCVYMYLNEIRRLNETSIDNLKIGDQIVFRRKEDFMDFILAKNNADYENLRGTFHGNSIKNADGAMLKLADYEIIKNLTYINNKQELEYEYYLYNILSNEKMKLTSTISQLRELMSIIVEHKLANVVIVDDEFVRDKLTILEGSKAAVNVVVDDNDIDYNEEVDGGDMEELLREMQGGAIEDNINADLDQLQQVYPPPTNNVRENEVRTNFREDAVLTNVIILDTETTGLPRKHESYKDTQSFDGARMIELGWLVCDANGKVIKERSILVKHPNLVINNSHIHNITLDMVRAEGKTFKDTIAEFEADLSSCGALVAHNMKFDRSILLAECWRYGATTTIEKFEKITQYCTLEMARRKLVDLPSKKLTEVHAHLLGKPAEEKHRALYDATMCKDCYYKLI